MTGRERPCARTGPVVLGVISDTHGLVRPELHRRLAGVDRILHAGDVGPQGVLDELSLIAPVHAVLGNTDPPDHPARLQDRIDLVIAGIRIGIIHGHQVGRPAPLQLAPLFPDADLVVFGHTHEPLSERFAGCHFLNPGSCGPRRFSLPVAAARVTIELAGEAAGTAETVGPGGPSSDGRFRIERFELVPG